MESSFKLLRIFSIAFKVFAWLMLVMISIALVGVVMSGDPQANTPPVYINMVMTAAVGFLALYSVGEIIRVLLIIEKNTRKA
jgi:uncharacterized membrane protein YiaA